MVKIKAVTVAVAAGILAVTTAGGAFAWNTAHRASVTCPNCGSEVELPVPDREARQPMNEEAFQAKLEEQVANGEITQEEADQKLADFKQRLSDKEATQEERKNAVAERAADGTLHQDEDGWPHNGKGNGHFGMGRAQNETTPSQDTES